MQLIKQLAGPCFHPAAEAHNSELELGQVQARRKSDGDLSQNCLTGAEPWLKKAKKLKKAKRHLPAASESAQALLRTAEKFPRSSANAASFMPKNDRLATIITWLRST